MKAQNPTSRLPPAPTLWRSGWELGPCCPACPGQSPQQQLVAVLPAGLQLFLPARSSPREPSRPCSQMPLGGGSREAQLLRALSLEPSSVHLKGYCCCSPAAEPWDEGADPGPGFLSCPVLLAQDCPEFGAGRLSSTSWPWFFPTLGLLMPHLCLSESLCPKLNYSFPPQNCIPSRGLPLRESTDQESQRHPNPLPEGGGNTVGGSRPDASSARGQCCHFANGHFHWDEPRKVPGSCPACLSGLRFRMGRGLVSTGVGRTPRRVRGYFSED